MNPGTQHGYHPPRKAAPPPRRFSNAALLAGVGGVVCLVAAFFVLLAAAISIAAVGAGAAVATSDDVDVIPAIMGLFFAFFGLVLGRQIIEGVAENATIPGIFIFLTIALGIYAHVTITRDSAKKGLGCIVLAYIAGTLSAMGLFWSIHANRVLPKLDLPAESSSSAPPGEGDKPPKP